MLTINVKSLNQEKTKTATVVILRFNQMDLNVAILQIRKIS